MSHHTRPSISRTLTRMNLLVSGSALLCACVLFAAYDFVSFRNTLLTAVNTQAEIVGANVVSAVVFNDAAAARETLGALAAAPNVSAARVYTRTGEPLAQFQRDAAQPLPSLPALDPSQESLRTVTARSVVFVRRIRLQREQVGFVVVEASLAAVYQRLGRYPLIAAGVLLMSLIATLFVSRIAQRTISGPIAALAELTRGVSQRNDYSMRARPGPDDARELAMLGDAVNEMLGGLEARERWLQEARDELEARVQARTLELEATNQELEAFSYSVSHDLRAPLRHVVGFANMLDQHAGPMLDEKGRRYTNTIVEAAGRMGRLIDDLLAFSRMGRAAITKQRIDLRALVEEARAEVAPQAAGREVHWTIHDLPPVHADPALLRPALINLLSNALKYTGTRERACIEIGTTPAADGETAIFIKDNGVGFDMEYAHKLFGVFQRLHASNEFAGTGIGLANVRRIIQRHGGRTWATGEVGVGATFCFSLPTLDVVTT